MGIGSALSTAISGLTTNQSAIDVIGNNLANQQTTSYKNFRNQFVNNFFNTLSLGSSPSVSSGSAGTNPRQVGQGSRVSAVSVDTRAGAPSTTGVPTDLYIQGNGYFVVNKGLTQLYTRDGSFRVNSTAQLVTSQGFLVQGFGVDQNFTIQETQITNLSIPIGALQVAEATRTAFMQGTLNPTKDLATQGTITQSTQLSNATTGASLVTTTAQTIGGQPLVALGGGATSATITYTPRKGGRTLDPASFTIDATTTLTQLATFIQGALGINVNDATTNAVPAAYDAAFGGGAGTGIPGNAVLDIDPTAAVDNRLAFLGNLGTANDITIDATDFSIAADQAGGTAIFNLDFDPNKVQTSDGESVATTFAIFDSLGTQINVTGTAYLAARGTESSQFNMLFDSSSQSILASAGPPPVYTTQRAIGNAAAQLVFDAKGQLSTVTNNTISIARQNTGAADPLSSVVDVNQIAALSVTTSRLAVVSQDGSPPGTLIDFGIDANGIIQGAFDNGISRTLGQVALARFANPAGLVGQESSLYAQGPNSGLPFVTVPGQSVGNVLSGALELSNVDVSRSFVDLITASTAFSANTRVIATAQDLFQSLLQLPR